MHSVTYLENRESVQTRPGVRGTTSQLLHPVPQTFPGMDAFLNSLFSCWKVFSKCLLGFVMKHIKYYVHYARFLMGLSDSDLQSNSFSCLAVDTVPT